MNRSVRYIGSSVLVLAILAHSAFQGFRAALADRPLFGRAIRKD